MTAASFPPFEGFKVINGEAPKSFHLSKAPRELVFIAAHHTNDPASLLYRLIDEQFKVFRPDIVLHESYYRQQIEGDPIEIIRKYGEPAYVCRLAHDLDIPFQSIELGHQAEYDAYVKKYDQESVTTFYILRQIWQYHRQESRAASFEAEVRTQFEVGFRELGAADFNWEALEAISQRLLDRPFAPDDPANLKYYKSITDPTKTGTIFNEISLYTSYIRDQAVVVKIAKLRDRYHRMLAVMGASHYYTIAPYLNELYGN